MGKSVINARELSRLFLSGAMQLSAQKEIINDLNVFPVPDGDTGTNMTMTIMSAAREVMNCDRDSMEAVCKCISSGSLRGARGNSGVILSQLLRGFTKVASPNKELDIDILADAFEKAVETAYKAVMKPKEGTILTVARAASERASELAAGGESDLEVFMKEIIAYAEETLEKTPDMLPVLKEAGVVDSGGRGLIEVLKGVMNAYLDPSLEIDIEKAEASGAAPSEGRVSFAGEGIDTEDIKFCYCTEFIIMLEKAMSTKQERDFKRFLESKGDSIVMVADDEYCKVHVHTNDPGLVIQEALSYGGLSNMKIDNMKLEHREKLFRLYGDGTADEIKDNGEAPSSESESAPAEHTESVSDAPSEDEAPHKEIGFVAVCAGEGLAEIFRSLGVDHVIEGGQTMNPSTEDITDAIDRVNADTVFVLPNNSNIILAANHAKDLTEDKDIRVIPTKTIPQGISAIVNFMEGIGADDNEEAMTGAVATVKSGELTYAIRNTTIDGTDIRKDDYMAIGDDGILSTGPVRADVAYEMLDALIDDETELISIYYGADVEETEAEELRSKVAEAHGNCDVELQFGGQPVYSYIVSAE